MLPLVPLVLRRFCPFALRDFSERHVSPDDDRRKFLNEKQRGEEERLGWGRASSRAGAHSSRGQVKIKEECRKHMHVEVYLWF